MKRVLVLGATGRTGNFVIKELSKYKSIQLIAGLRSQKDKEILIDIKKAINSSIELRSKKELIEGFIDRVNSSKNVTDDFKKFVFEEN